MADLPAVDAHVHTMPTREIGRQAMMGEGHTDYGGTVEELLPLMKRAGITHAVMMNVTPVTDMRDAALAKLPADLAPALRAEAEEEIRRTMIGRLKRRNRWTCQVASEHPQLIPFIGLDPMMTEEELLSEIEESRADGARGIKLHPGAQRFLPNDPRLRPAYERAQEVGWPVVFHSGVFALGGPRRDHARLENFPPLLMTYPRLTVVLAHMGMGDFRACAAIARDYPNAAFDTCFIMNGTERAPLVSDEAAAEAIRRAGVDRVMFGSDYPWFDPALDVERMRRLPLTAAEKRAVLRENAARIFGL